MCFCKKKGKIGLDKALNILICTIVVNSLCITRWVLNSMRLQYIGFSRKKEKIVSYVDDINFYQVVLLTPGFPENLIFCITLSLSPGISFISSTGC